MCTLNLGPVFINCKPFYSPREFLSFILGNTDAAMQQLTEQISETEQRYLDSLLIVLGDFNKANLSRELPKYRQHVTYTTRDGNILDHCYTTIKDIIILSHCSFEALRSLFISFYTDLQTEIQSS